MWPKVALIALVMLISAIVLSNSVSAQNDGRYRPPTTPARSSVNDGRYRPVSDGRYRGGNDGRYVHVDVPYLHDAKDDEGYKGDKNRFGPGGGGGGGGGGAGKAGGAGGSGRTTGAGGGGKADGGSKATAAGSEAGKTTGAKKLKHEPLPKGKGASGGGNGWRILQLFDKEEKDGYQYIYETENGILAQENGRIETLAPEANGLRSSGFYEYTGDDGLLYRVDYVADDRGFVPQGLHLPTPPPYVEKLVAYLTANAKN